MLPLAANVGDVVVVVIGKVIAMGSVVGIGAIGEGVGAKASCVPKNMGK